MQKLFCFIFLFTFIIFSFAQISVNIKVIDKQNKTPILGAAAYAIHFQKGEYTNEQGEAHFLLPKDSVTFLISANTYNTEKRFISLQKDTILTIELLSYTTESVDIQDKRDYLQNKTQMSISEISVEELNKMPAILGSHDVIRAVQLLPGVQAAKEGSNGFYVRGGSPDQNLILLDNVPIYYANHLGGLASVFNSDIIDNVQLIKGGFPAQYGGRLSSVLAINVKQGDMQKYHASANLNLLDGKIAIEGPIWKNKMSFIISARRSFTDFYTKPASRMQFRSNGNDGYVLYRFYDLNAKLAYQINPKNHLYLNAYAGNDNISIRFIDNDTTWSNRKKSSVKNNWGNQVLGLQWKHLRGEKGWENLTLGFTRYHFSIDTDYEDKQTYVSIQKTFTIAGKNKYTSALADIVGKYEVAMFPSARHAVRFGVGSTYHSFVPGRKSVYMSILDSVVEDTVIGSPQTHSLESYVYLQDEWNVSEKISANLGVHAVHYLVNQKSFFSVQPRFSAKVLLPHEFAWKSSFVTMAQFIHLLSNADISVPVDLWVPATKNIPPQQVWQAATGIAKTFEEGKWEISWEGYYKQMRNIIDYKEGMKFFSKVATWEDLVETKGKGWAFGSEFFLRKKKGKLTGWAGYTLAWNLRQFDNINLGKVFPYKYDTRHSINALISYDINKNIQLSAAWTYNTGSAVTLAASAYEPAQNQYPQLPYLTTYIPGFGSYGTNEPLIYIYANGRNGFRFRPYHRLDLAANFTKEKKHYTRVWNISIYNAYARQNPYFYYIDEKRGGSKQFPRVIKNELKQVSLIPVPVPMVSYEIRF